MLWPQCPSLYPDLWLAYMGGTVATSSLQGPCSVSLQELWSSDAYVWRRVLLWVCFDRGAQCLFWILVWYLCSDLPFRLVDLAWEGRVEGHGRRPRRQVLDYLGCARRDCCEPALPGLQGTWENERRGCWGELRMEDSEPLRVQLN